VEAVFGKSKPIFARWTLKREKDPQSAIVRMLSAAFMKNFYCQLLDERKLFETI
jgi:hypothetical protein